MKIKVKQKDEHSMFSNMMFFMSLLFKASPLLVIGELIWGVMNNLPSTLISVLGIKYVIDIAASGERLNRIYYVVLVCAGLLIISKLICFLYREFSGMCKRKRHILTLTVSFMKRQSRLIWSHMIILIFIIILF